MIGIANFGRLNTTSCRNGRCESGGELTHLPPARTRKRFATMWPSSSDFAVEMMSGREYSGCCYDRKRSRAPSDDRANRKNVPRVGEPHEGAPARKARRVRAAGGRPDRSDPGTPGRNRAVPDEPRRRASAAATDVKCLIR